MRGRFISFEGADGVGKSTQIDRFCTFLTTKSIKFHQTREPGGTDFGLEIRKILVHSQNYHIAPIESLCLLLAMRHAHWHQVIEPALASGIWVVSDRFHDSTIAYQAYGEGLDPRLIKRLSSVVLGKINTDRTIILTMDAAMGLARSQRTSNNETRYEEMGLAFQQRVAQGFLTLARNHPRRVKIINAAQSMDAVHRDIIRSIPPKWWDL